MRGNSADNGISLATLNEYTANVKNIDIANFILKLIIKIKLKI